METSALSNESCITDHLYSNQWRTEYPRTPDNGGLMDRIWASPGLDFSTFSKDELVNCDFL